jgi:CRISPR/Cas system CMR-associated protein Cmr1 (group 7 of RAMP superfamily)
MKEDETGNLDYNGNPKKVKDNDTYTFDEENWDDIEKKGLLFDDVSIKISSFNEILIHFLCDNLEQFFVVTNFGTRTSKGFGSFTATSIICGSGNHNLSNNYLELLKNNYKYVYSKKASNSLSAFNVIKEDYQRLKAGVNFRTYEKSMLFCYFNKQNIGWEKKEIKVKMQENHITPNSKQSNNPNRSCSKCNSIQANKNNHQYIRALLGLAEHYEFNNTKIYVEVNGGDNFQRFQSPITFKIINNEIYLLANPITTDILCKEITFQIYEKRGKDKIPKGNSFPINTPDSFNLKEFLEQCVGNNNKLNYKKEQSL